MGTVTDDDKNTNEYCHEWFNSEDDDGNLMHTTTAVTFGRNKANIPHGMKFNVAEKKRHEKKSRRDITGDEEDPSETDPSLSSRSDNSDDDRDLTQTKMR